ncbi:CRM-domain containing factor CFM2, chloroplastic, partial [Mucuna pruriens]
MLLPATHFHFPFFHTFPSPCSSSPSFPLQFPKTKFLVRCSIPTTQTRRSSVIERIAEKLRSLGITEPPPSSSGSEIHVPFPHELPKRRVGHTFEASWSTPLNPVPLPGTGIAALSASEVARQKRLRKEELRRRKDAVPTLAELSLPDSEIRRLTTLGFRTKKKVRLAKAGITERIVNVIHERWQRCEVVRVACEEFSRIDLRRTHDLLERKTGGLVVWRSGCKIILYRGADYKYLNFPSDNVLRQDNTSDALQHINRDDKYYDKSESHSSEITSAACAVHSSNVQIPKPALILGVGTPNIVRFQLPDEAELAEDTDCLLMGLGPRFTDWWGCDPPPVDADLLPAVIYGYRKPFRLLPYGVKPKLTDDEMTTLKRLGRPLPCHFALGRNRKLQGLADAIIKLWERCEIVKIAVKRGVQNTSSKIMAKELKHLTGGILLSRDREFFVFYRGKDYLPAAMSSAIKQQRNIGMYKLKAAMSSAFKQRRNIGIYKLKAGNRSSFTVTPDLKDGTIECDSEVKSMNFQKDTKQRMLIKAEAAIKRTSIKLWYRFDIQALEKKAKAERLLAELVNAESPQEQEIDKEGITKEEKYMLRRIGLTMKPFLLLGRRGVFDGTVENMHLHWKYRELVKIICNGSLEDVHQIALTLEAESGGILVAVERVRKGFAIIVYRGKNYSFPACLRPQTLLNKRQALKRSIEAQRRESLELHILTLDKKINELKLQMVEDKEANSKQIAEALRFNVATDKHEPCSNSINWNSSKEASVDNQQAIQEQPVKLISGGAHQEASVDNLQAIQEHSVELIDSGGAHQGEPENFVSWNSSREASIDHQQAIQEQPVELIDGGGSHQEEPESWPSLIHKETQLDGVSESVVDTESSILSKIDAESSAPVINMSLPSRSAQLSTKERLLLRKQALKMIKQPVLAIGKSNIVSGVVQTIKAHFQNHPLAIVNVKGRAKGTSVQELVFKLEQETGALLVSREPSKVILYRGWPAEKPSPAIYVTKVSNGEETKPIFRVRNRKRRISRIRTGKRRLSRTGSRSNLYFRRDSTPTFSAGKSERRNLGDLDARYQ